MESKGGGHEVGSPSLGEHHGGRRAQGCMENNDQDVLTKAGYFQ